MDAKSNTIAVSGVDSQRQTGTPAASVESESSEPGKAFHALLDLACTPRRAGLRLAVLACFLAYSFVQTVCRVHDDPWDLAFVVGAYADLALLFWCLQRVERLASESPAAAAGRHRRLPFYAAFYMMLIAAVLLNAAVPRASANAGTSYAAAVVGFSLWTAAVVLLLLSFMHQRFPSAAVAAARLAQAALEAFFRDLLVMDQHGEVPAAAAGHHRLDRRLRFYAAFYMMLAAAVLVNAAVPRDSANAGTSYAAAAAVGLSLWTAAVALLMLSFMHQPFQSAAAAAARLAQATLEAFFRDLLVMDQHGEVPAAAAGHHRLDRRLRFYAAFYMMLAAAVLLNAAVPRDSANAGTNYAAAVVGFSLWTAAVALLLLSFMHQRFPSAAAAAARLAQGSLEAFLL